MITLKDMADRYVAHHEAGRQIIDAIHTDDRLRCDVTEDDGALMIAVRSSESRAYYHPVASLKIYGKGLKVACFGPDGNVDVSEVVGTTVYDERGLRRCDTTLDYLIQYLCTRIHLHADHTKTQQQRLSTAVQP